MIQMENLTKYYNTTCALDKINIKVNQGEIIGLLGPNGAGKTTTLRILTCYLSPTEGTIKVKDYNIHENPLEIKKMIGYLPESAPIYKHMIVYDYLSYVASIREIQKGDREKRIEEIAKLCGLNEVMHKSVNELSKGFNQRVGLAHAMMSDPEILILDEPTSGLDPNQRIEVRDIIKEIGKKKTVIISTHILPEVESTCDRVIIINKGKIVADDDIHKLKELTGKDYIINFSLQNAEAANVKSSLSHIENIKEIKIIDTSDNILKFQIQCTTGKDLRPVIYQEIKKQDWILLEMMQEKASLESIFRKLTLDMEV